MAISFAEIGAYKLSGVQVNDKELGHGSYATVLELDYMGIKCAGKRVHHLLLRDEEITTVTQHFAEECHLLSQIRHPNIVQFLGVYFQEGEITPILVMEFLQCNLTTCIKKRGVLPKEITYSILHDIAVGISGVARPRNLVGHKWSLPALNLTTPLINAIRISIF